jgi:hypothetical protein
MPLTALTLRLARDIARSLEREHLAYLESCEEDRRAGYRAHYCEHGTNRWTDHDNICGPCEDGWTLADGVTRRRLALDRAKIRIDTFHEITGAVNILKRHDVDVIDAIMPRMTALLTA